MQPLKYDLYCIILYLRTWQQDMTTFMRPLLCVLQPKIQEAHRTTHTGTTTRCRTQRRNRLRVETIAPATAAQTRVPFIAACSNFTRKNARFRAPAFSPTQVPCNIHAAITMRFAASRGHPACIYARGNTRCQQSCSHCTAICSHMHIQEAHRTTHT